MTLSGGDLVFARLKDRHLVGFMKRNILLHRLAVLAVLATSPLFLASAAYSESSSEKSSGDIPVLFISPGSYSVSREDLPGTSSVVDKDSIRLSHPVSVPDLFKMIPGVYKAGDSAWGSEVNIRGLSRESVVLLIDGARVNTATDINAQYGLIDPNDIERIEVQKGPISSKYGSGSIGGVVNIITKTGKYSSEPKVGAQGIQTLQTNGLGAQMYGASSYSASDHYLYVSQSFRDVDSYKGGDRTDVHNSQFRDYQTAIRGGHQFANSQEVTAQLQVFEGEDIGIPGTGTAPLPTNADVTYPRVGRVLGQAVYKYTPQSEVLDASELNLYFQRIDRRADVDDFPAESPVIEITPSATHDTLGSRWTNTLVFVDHLASIGLDVWQRDLESSRSRYLRSGAVVEDTPLPKSKFLSYGAFAEDAWSLSPELTLSAGARLDGIEVSNDQTPIWEEQHVNDANWNAHVGAAFDLSKQVDLTIVGASGYRAASLEERYAYLVLGSGQEKLGNPYLDPERSLFAETAIHWKGDSHLLSFALFVNDLNDLIRDKRIDENTIVAANISQATLYGGELEARVLPSDVWELYSTLALVYGRDETQHQVLPYLPPLNGTSGVKAKSEGGVFSGTELAYAFTQHNVPTDTESSSGWATLRAYAGKSFTIANTKHELQISIDNILDQKYEDYLSTSRQVDLLERGRSISLTYCVDL